MKKIAATLLVAASALLLAGCASAGHGNEPAPQPTINNDKPSRGALYERTITLQNGKVVDCILYGNYGQGGISCDWDHPRTGE